MNTLHSTALRFVLAVSFVFAASLVFCLTPSVALAAMPDENSTATTPQDETQGALSENTLAGNTTSAKDSSTATGTNTENNNGGNTSSDTNETPQAATTTNESGNSNGGGNSVGSDNESTTNTDSETTTNGSSFFNAKLTSNQEGISLADSADSSQETTTTTYTNNSQATATSADGATTVTFTVQWNDPVAGEDTTFHVTQTGGSSAATARMDVPTYKDPDGSSESVCDPTRNDWGSYKTIGDGYDFSFNFTASGQYYMIFYFADNTSKIYYARTTFFIAISDANHPAVSTIVANAVAQAKTETDGGEYNMALWLHDWELEQLDYDYSLNYCSAESGLTRGKGTCESFQRIYQKLLTTAGIENARMTGNGHTWNAMKVDGKWCQVDVNWDDDDGTKTKTYGFDATHLYFGLTDELMSKAHSDHATTYQADGYAYRSTDLSNNYFVRNGQATTWAQAYVDRIQAQLDAKAEGFSINSDNASLPPSINGIQNGIVAYAMNQLDWTAAGNTVELAASSVVTTISSTSWTAVYDFIANYYYSLIVYKPSADSSTWTAPTMEGYAFAGWYTDSSCTTPYTAITGSAYARFVPVSDLVKFRGCSLCNNYNSADKTAMRYAFEFSVPAGATRTDIAWDWTNATTGKSGTVTSSSFWLLDDGESVLANVVFINLRRSAEAITYDTVLTAAGKVSYITADGTTVTAILDGISRTVNQVAQLIASGTSANATEKAYAKQILGSTENSSEDSSASASSESASQSSTSESTSEDSSSQNDSLESTFVQYDDISVYKPSADSSTWTAPTMEGYAFAGWYTDSSCTTPYTAITGSAYARFVPVSDLVKFRGCSLCNNYNSADKTAMRYAFEFSVPTGATRTDIAWDWTNATTGKSGTVTSSSFWLLDDGESVLANVVFINLRRSAEAITYDTVLTATGKVSYITADGTTVTAILDGISRTVNQVAQLIASGTSANATEKAYAGDIIGA